MKKEHIIALSLLVVVLMSCGVLYAYKDSLLEQPLTSEQKAVLKVEEVPEVSAWLAKFDGPNRVSTVSKSQAYVEVETEDEEGYIVWVYSMVPNLDSSGQEITAHAVTFDRFRVSKDLESVTKIERESASTPTVPPQSDTKSEELSYMKERESMLNSNLKNQDDTEFIFKNGYSKMINEGEYIRLKSEQVWFGDIDGNGKVDGFAVARFNYGGTGNWYSVLMASDVSETTKVLTYALELPDDVGVVNEIVISPQKLVVDLYYRGPEDPNCCSTKHRKEAYTYVNGEFTKAGVDELGDRPQE